MELNGDSTSTQFDLETTVVVYNGERNRSWKVFISLMHLYTNCYLLSCWHDAVSDNQYLYFVVKAFFTENLQMTLAMAYVQISVTLIVN